MISKNLAKNDLAVAVQLRDIGIHLAPRDNSVLGDLHEAAIPFNFVKPGAHEVTVLPGGRVQNDNFSTWTLTDPEIFVDSLVVSTSSQTDSAAHSVAVASLADDYAPLIRGHIAMARNVVVPLVAQFEEDADRYLKLAASINPASEFKVLVHRVPALLGDESFNSMGLDQVVNLNELNDQKPRYTLVLSDVDQVVAEICNLGNDRLNGLLADWLEFAPENLIKNVLVANYTAFSSYDELGYYVYDAFTLRRGDQAKSMHLSLAMWLISNYLTSNVKQTTESVSLEKYMEAMSFQREQAGVTLKAALDQIGRHIQNDVLLLSMIPSRKEVTVNERVYRKFVEEGGKTEALFGMLVTEKSYYNLSQVLEKQAELVESWNRYLSYRSSKDLTDIRSNFKSWVRSYMAVAICEQGDEEANYEKTECPGLKIEIMKHVDAEIEHLGHRLHEDIPHTALHMVAKARFYYTSAYELLNEMRQISLMNPDIDPREAATAATISYIVNYLATQVNIVKALG